MNALDFNFSLWKWRNVFVSTCVGSRASFYWLGRLMSTCCILSAALQAWRGVCCETQSETVDPPAGKHQTVVTGALHGRFTVPFRGSARRPTVWFPTWESECERCLSLPSQTGPSGSDSDYKTCSRVSMRHGWISIAQPVIVMAAVAGRGDTGPIIGFLRSGHTREGRRTQRTVSLHQTESIRAGLCTPSSPTWKWGRKDSTSCTSTLFHTPTQAAPCKILCAVRRIMALLTLVPTWIKMDSAGLYSYNPAIKWIFPVEKLLQGAVLFIGWGKPTKREDELSAVTWL